MKIKKRSDGSMRKKRLALKCVVSIGDRMLFLLTILPNLISVNAASSSKPTLTLLV